MPGNARQRKTRRLLLPGALLALLVSVAPPALGKELRGGEQHRRGSREKELRVLDAGATDAALRAVVRRFEVRTGWRVRLTPGPVGTLRDRVFSGQRADVAVLTPAAISQLETRGALQAGPPVAVGRVGGGIAVRAGLPLPSVGSADALRRALLEADEVYYPDPAVATAGAHFLEVADQLGMGEVVRRKGHTAADGTAAMQRMLRSPARAIGFTQQSEILAAKGVVLVGPYPPEFQQFTTYSGVVLARAPHPRAARAFLRFLATAPVQARFRAAGFEAASP